MRYAIQIVSAGFQGDETDTFHIVDTKRGLIVESFEDRGLAAHECKLLNEAAEEGSIQ